MLRVQNAHTSLGLKCRSQQEGGGLPGTAFDLVRREELQSRKPRFAICFSLDVSGTAYLLGAHRLKLDRGQELNTRLSGRAVPAMASPKRMHETIWNPVSSCSRISAARRPCSNSVGSGSSRTKPLIQPAASIHRVRRRFENSPDRPSVRRTSAYWITCSSATITISISRPHRPELALQHESSADHRGGGRPVVDRMEHQS